MSGGSSLENTGQSYSHSENVIPVISPVNIKEPDGDFHILICLKFIVVISVWEASINPPLERPFVRISAVWESFWSISSPHSSQMLEMLDENPRIHHKMIKWWSSRAMNWTWKTVKPFLTWWMMITGWLKWPGELLGCLGNQFYKFKSF